ncbi:MAG: hypothetical protein R6V44_05505, partial [Paracoccaceae bacterium]
MAAPQDPPEKGVDRPHPPDFGAAIPAGLGLNLLVADVDRAARWQAAILGARVLYWEEHFAVLSAAGATWFLHSDWSYRGHPLRGAVAGVEARGAGAEGMAAIGPVRMQEPGRAGGGEHGEVLLPV